MKLAEALQERADINIRLSQLRERMVCNALVQEGESTAEDPGELLREFDECVTRLEYLMNRINLTNCATIVNGKTLTELIAHRDCLKERVNTLRRVLGEASQPTKRVMRSEIKILSAIDVREQQKLIDNYSKELRFTDNLIQSVNWTTDLIEN